MQLVFERAARTMVSRGFARGTQTTTTQLSFLIQTVTTLKLFAAGRCTACD